MSLPERESKARIARVQELLRRRGLDCALVYYDELAIANGWYLSGWCPQFESGMVLVPREGEAMILGGAESEPFAKSDSAIKTTRNIPNFMVPEEEYPNSVISSFEEVFREIGRTRRISRIGIVGMSRMPLGVYQDIGKQLHDKELVDITAEFEAFRKVKSPYEVEQIRRSFELGDAAYKEVVKELAPGKTEYEIAAVAEYTGRRLGANGFGFKTIAAVGERSDGCVPTATDRKLRAGELLLFGFSFRYNGYCSAVGNTLVVGGEPTPRQRELLADLSTAYTLTRDALKIGRNGKEIDAPARAYFREKGYLKYLICPFAHTIGLFEAEAPFFGPNGTDRLEENMCVCVDVSFFNHPEFHGVRIETGFHITKDGPKPFSPFMDQLLSSYSK